MFIRLLLPQRLLTRARRIFELVAAQQVQNKQHQEQMEQMQQQFQQLQQNNSSQPSSGPSVGNIPKLKDDSNYYDWRGSIDNHLHTTGLFEYVETDIPKPENNDALIARLASHNIVKYDTTFKRPITTTPT